MLCEPTGLPTKYTASVACWRNSDDINKWMTQGGNPMNDLASDGRAPITSRRAAFRGLAGLGAAAALLDQGIGEATVSLAPPTPNRIPACSATRAMSFSFQAR